MTPRVKAFWGFVLLLAAVCVLLRCYDNRVEEQSGLALEGLSQAQSRYIAHPDQNEEPVTADPARGPKAEGPIAKAADQAKAYVWPQPSQALRENPKLQAAYLAAKRASLAAAYGPLFRRLHLSLEQTQALSELIIQREENAFDTAAAVPSVFTSMTESTGDAAARLVINPSDPATYSAGRLPLDPSLQDDNTQAAVALLRQGIERFNASATALLGEANFKALQEFEQTLPLQPHVREFASVLALASQPLDLAQVDALSEALAQATPSYRQGGDAIPQSINWDEASVSLSSVLTPAQQTVLRYRLAYSRENMHFFRQLDQLSGSK